MDLIFIIEKLREFRTNSRLVLPETIKFAPFLFYENPKADIKKKLIISTAFELMVSEF